MELPNSYSCLWSCKHDFAICQNCKSTYPRMLDSLKPNNYACLLPSGHYFKHNMIPKSFLLRNFVLPNNSLEFRSNILKLVSNYCHPI